MTPLEKLTMAALLEQALPCVEAKYPEGLTNGGATSFCSACMQSFSFGREPSHLPDCSGRRLVEAIKEALQQIGLRKT